MAKQSVALEVLSYHATAQNDETEKLMVWLIFQFKKEWKIGGYAMLKCWMHIWLTSFSMISATCILWHEQILWINFGHNE